MTAGTCWEQEYNRPNGLSVEKAPKSDLYLYVQELMQNQNVPIEMWNINKHRHRTNSAVEGLIFKLKSIMGEQQPYVFLRVQKLTEINET